MVDVKKIVLNLFLFLVISSLSDPLLEAFSMLSKYVKEQAFIACAMASLMYFATQTEVPI